MAIASDQLEAKGPDRSAEGTVSTEDSKGPGPYVITVGNMKGGTGKSTIAMHLAVALLRRDLKVGTVDLDGTQGTLSRYLSKREAFAKKSGQDLPMPRHRRLMPSTAATRVEAEAEDRAALAAALAALADRNFLVIDTPGGDSFLSQLGHLEADTLLTPINDSLLDIDVLADIDTERREVLAPSSYTKMVWQQNDLRGRKGQPPIDWIVMRNRLTHIDARNKRQMAALLVQLVPHIGYTLASGFGERVIFRELFDKGLTLLDLPEGAAREYSLSSHRAADDEMQTLLRAVGVVQQEVSN